jgi:hypothetical protein
MRILVLLLVGLCAPVAAPADRTATQNAAQNVAQPVAASAPSTRTELVAALAVLRHWDAHRARAWARADPDALSGLYVSGSGAGRADVRLLRAYRARRFVVRRLVTQVFAVRVLHSNSTAIHLRVFDRVAGGEVLRHGDVVPLRSSPPVTRTITFRLHDGTWRVSEVSDWGRAPRAARP